MLLKLTLFALLSTVLADSFCSNGVKVEYCYYGCCNTGRYSSQCCSIPAGTVVGIVIGIIAFIAVVAIAVVCGRRRYMTRTTIAYGGGVAQPQVITTTQNSGGVSYGGPQPFYAPPATGYAQAPPPYAANTKVGY